MLPKHFALPSFKLITSSVVTGSLYVPSDEPNSLLPDPQMSGRSLQHGHYSKLATPNLQHTKNREQDDQCGNSTTQSQAPDDGYINVRNMLST